MKLPVRIDIEKLRKTATGEGSCADSSVMLFCTNEPVICCSNAMLEQDDPTAHASIVATRLKRREIKKANRDCYIVLSEKPCPMCMSGVTQARIRNLFYIEDSEIKYMDLATCDIENWYEKLK